MLYDHYLVMIDFPATLQFSVCTSRHDGWDMDDSKCAMRAFGHMLRLENIDLSD